MAYRCTQFFHFFKSACKIEYKNFTQVCQRVRRTSKWKKRALMYPLCPLCRIFVQAGSNYSNGNNYKKPGNKGHVLKNHCQVSKSSRRNKCWLDFHGQKMIFYLSKYTFLFCFVSSIWINSLWNHLHGSQ